VIEIIKIDKVPNFIMHHRSETYIKKIYCSDYMSYIDILFICKQAFNVDLKEIRVQDERENEVLYDALTLEMLTLHRC